MIYIESIYDNSIIAIESTATFIIVESSFIAGGGGGGGTWGSITGTLSNQLDLQNALDAKVPYSGATANVNLGEYGISAGYEQFDTTPTGTGAVGRLIWNDTDGTLDLGLKGGNVNLQIGQEEVVRVVNKTGSSLNESAYQVVKVSTAQGQRLGVGLAQANNDANSADTLGLVTETIANNQEGFITVSGLVNNINTTGSLQGETWADGDLLFLSPTTAGAITNVRPTAPNHTVILGYVVYAHANNGKIYVKVDNGYELDELHNVKITSPTNGQVLKYNSSLTVWENATDAGGISSLNSQTGATQTFATGTTGTDFAISSSSNTHTFNIPDAGASARGLISTGTQTIAGAKTLTGDTVISGVFRPRMATNRQTASYTLALTDEGKLIEMNLTSANNLTVPENSTIAFPIGSQILISQYGTGQTTIVADSGVTLRSVTNNLKLRTQYSGASLIKIASNEWYVFGDLTT